MEGAEYQRQLLRDVFGGSSDSEEEEAEVFDEVSSSLNNQSTDAERGLPLSASIPNPSRSWSWQRIEAINGLWLSTDFLSPQQQSSLLFAIKKGYEIWGSSFLG
uniref:Uncharacterized protein n=1 Tax=Opuntia streptacantha TaxID=393608 RepID=A0A7C9CL80_OPUST